MSVQTGIHLPSLTSLGISPDVISENLGQGLILTDPSGAIQFVNSSFCDVTGYSASEVLGKNPRLLGSGYQAASFFRQMWTAIGIKGRWEGEIRNRRKNGEIYTEWLSISSLKREDGSIAHYLGVFSDISKRKEAEQEIWHRANHDALTDLPNRSLFEALLNRAIAQARRDRGSLSVAFLDLDHLKEVNDRWGHETGDTLLVETARRIRRSIRDTDVASRFGGDEFVLLLGDAGDRVAISWIAEKILASLRAPLVLVDRTIDASASMGISTYPGNGGSAEALVGAADQAMYAAKKAGRDRFHFASHV